tara:strand:+ start:3328 stop:3618 length:291 start_codon:yes stop_codon:yes gene_type:complete
MRNNLILVLIALFFISSCTGFGMKRSKNADEFLIQKKNPLIMPPDIEDLPEPKQDIKEEDQTEFKKILSSNKKNTINTNSGPKSSLTESIIEKIEN